MDRLTALVKVYPPKADEASGDRRSKVATNATAPTSAKRMTRSDTRRAKTECETLAEDQQPLVEERCDGEGDKSARGDNSSSEDEEEPVQITLPNRYAEAEGGVAWRGDEQAEGEKIRTIPDNAKEQWARTLDATVMPPGAYHFSPGWYQTGMENVGGTPSASQLS